MVWILIGHYCSGWMDSIKFEKAESLIVLIECPCPYLNFILSHDFQLIPRPTVVLDTLIYYLRYVKQTLSRDLLPTLLSRNISFSFRPASHASHLYSSSPPIQMSLTVRVTIQSYLTYLMLFNPKSWVTKGLPKKTDMLTRVQVDLTSRFLCLCPRTHPIHEHVV